MNEEELSMDRCGMARENDYTSGRADTEQFTC